jgi:isoleucyl-tRNA synthetase
VSENQPADYKETINLPKTDFPMRGKLPQTEPKTIEFWIGEDIYHKMLEKNKNSEKFVMPDGPPYANGNIHLGHVLNKVLKDIIIKYKNMQGFYSAFIPGWDCHGLPIEVAVGKKLGKKKREMSDSEVRDECRNFAKGMIETQKQQFKRLGVLADWERPYLTLNPGYEAEEIRVLAKINDNGFLFRGEKPVNWCPTLQTALAAAEVEYADHTSPSIYVKFKVKDGLEKIGSPDKPTSFVIWTTTPWTLPANYGICVNEKFDYGLYETGSEYLIIAEDLQEHVEKDTGLELKKVKSFKGDTLEHMRAQHPFLDRESLLMLGQHVTLEAGTGCVHTAPAYGLDDYNVGLKYGLPVKGNVDKAGKFTSDMPNLEGKKVWDANKDIIGWLKDSGDLLGYREITHSYPHNPRTKTPLIFRATPQWFIRMDGDGNTLRKQALNEVNESIRFVPEWGAARLRAMVENSPDWCISRQRTWGVPIPVFYCDSCEEALVDSEVMNRVADVMESSNEGIEAYFNREVSEFVGDKSCSKCGGKSFTRGQDILDVWFDSGVCHTAVQKKLPELSFPADIYLEGSDQHRGWFQTSLMSSVAAYGSSPYKALITHGFVNDAEGKKMSKSKGNVIDPADISKQYGSEILRLWVAYEDYGQDVTVGNEMFKRISETYRRIRNTMRFLLGNLYDFDPTKDKVDFESMPEVDRWALIKLNELIEKVTEAYESYNFYKVYHALNHFFTVELSATYLDILKDRLYTGKATGLKRRASQTVIYELLTHLTRMMAPILSFIAEETYRYIPGSDQSSVFLEPFPQPNSKWLDKELTGEFSTLLEMRSKVSKVLEELRNEKTIGSSLDAKVSIVTSGENYKILNKYKDNLCEMFIISQVELNEGDEQITAKKASGEKCVRCWNYSEKTGENKKYPQACPKCVEALS